MRLTAKFERHKLACACFGSPAMVGETLSHYRILTQIGAGGMGVVYKAYDEQLEREVALKVISPGLLTDEGARRSFRKEALALLRPRISLR